MGIRRSWADGPVLGPRGRWVLVAGALGLVLLILGATWSILAAPATSCQGRSGEIEIYCVLTVGRGVVTCAAGNLSNLRQCQDGFGLTVKSPGSGASAPVPIDLQFEIVSSSGIIERMPFTITLLTPLGCGAAEYNSTYNFWGSVSIVPACTGGESNSSPILSGEHLLLTSIPPGGLGFLRSGDRLMVIGDGLFCCELLVPMD